MSYRGSSHLRSFWSFPLQSLNKTLSKRNTRISPPRIWGFAKRRYWGWSKTRYYAGWDCFRRVVFWRFCFLTGLPSVIFNSIRHCPGNLWKWWQNTIGRRQITERDAKVAFRDSWKLVSARHKGCRVAWDLQNSLSIYYKPISCLSAGRTTTNEELEDMLESGNPAVFTQGVSDTFCDLTGSCPTHILSLNV